jgi:hypothetical protein
MNTQTLNITRIVPDSEGNLLRMSKDNREYIQLEFEKPSAGNVLSTAKPRYKNTWGEGGTINAKADRLFTQVKARKDTADEQGYFNPPLAVVASIQTVKIKPHFIPNEYGKEVQNNVTGNIVREYTSVVFEDENIESIARSNGMIPLSDLETQTSEPISDRVGQAQPIDEELVSEEA